MSPTPTSPRMIQIDPDLPRPSHSRSIPMSPSTALSPRVHRSSVNRPYDPERQKEQDIESALSLQRARSGSMANEPGTSPVVRPSNMGYPSTSPIDENPFPMLSEAEEAAMDRARSSGFGRSGAHDEESDDEGHPAHRVTYGSADEEEEERGEGMMDLRRRHSGGPKIGSGGESYSHSQGSSSGHDSHSRLLGRSDEGGSGLRHELRRHGMERANSDRFERDQRERERNMGLQPGTVGRLVFDFAHMDDFAIKERGGSPGVRNGASGSAGQDETAPTAAAGRGSVQFGGTSLERTDTQDLSVYGDETVGSPQMGTTESPGQVSVASQFHRRRQRKLSASNPVQRRQGKLALFESIGGLGANGDAEPEAKGATTAYKAPRGGKTIMSDLPGAGAGAGGYSDAVPDPGHDKPYRFSFYSNALPVTIHARTLAELPSEGQTFEDLFKGKGSAMDAGATAEDQKAMQTGEMASVATGTRGSGANTPVPGAGDKGRSVVPMPSQPTGPPGGAGSPPSANGEDEPEAMTWWLDVLSPTDEEMRMLSKVFGIHPLTTEDILLEETREKIELFRNYYLVCFRSFDQDPYSQTYLEPLNMYIIVFREGTLSVRKLTFRRLTGLMEQFHFRGTPHPQNVRRRIKQLKDYISVTSDWISYALIDDITDAFGPLIQSIEYEVDSIDELVLILKEAEQSDMLRRIGTCRKKVMGLLRLMGNKADVVKGLAKRCNEQWLVAPKSDIGLYLSDIQDHLITMTQNLNHYEKILSRSHSNYLAQISIEMTDANNQINDVLSKLTALGTVLIPMNLVTGLWGMNVHVPGQDVTTGYAWFGGILGCLAAFAIIGAYATYKCFVR